MQPNSLQSSKQAKSTRFIQCKYLNNVRDIERNNETKAIEGKVMLFRSHSQHSGFDF